MNKEIKQLIELYYNDLKPENLMHLREGISTPDYIIYKSLYEPNPHYWNLMYEEFHTISIFDKVIYNITKLIDNENIEYNKLIYTKWNYSIKTSQVIKHNNENKDIPIYIKLIKSSDTHVYAALQEDITDKIVIELNMTAITNYDFLRECLVHELFHAREMFAVPNKNVLKSKKNQVITINEENVFKWDTGNKFFNIALILCQTLSDSEIRARLNAVAYKIRNTNNKIFEGILRDKIIDYAIILTDNDSLLTDIIENITRINLMSKHIISSAEPIIYYCHKFNIIKTNLLNYSFEYRKPNSQYSDKEKDLIQAGLFEVEYKLHKFKIQLQRIIYNELKKKKELSINI